MTLSLIELPTCTLVGRLGLLRVELPSLRFGREWLATASSAEECVERSTGHYDPAVAIIAWAALTVFGMFCIAAGRRVLIDPDWEDGDWWVLTSWVALRGLIFAVLFPVVRTDHTRAQERTNALWVILWGVAVTIIGISMVFYERSH